jgi:RHH-type proline utilization regulon transcriptional repressor/proline dehydrogenase/delta 1-pyrroline-5-carboxylate dehydrogenase
VRELLAQARQPDADRAAIQATAADLVRRVRARAKDQGAIEAFMRQYDLGSEEGVLLMCVAEALLRIPTRTPPTSSSATSSARPTGRSTWAVRFGPRECVHLGPDAHRPPRDLADDTARRAQRVQAADRRAGEPVVRLAVRQAMRIMGHQFVMGRTIGEALARSAQGRQRGLPLFVRHAGRRRADRRMRCATSGVPRRDRCDRRSMAVRRPMCSPRRRSR